MKAAKKTTTAPKPTPKAPATTANPKFGSPAWNAKYGIGKKKAAK